MSINLHVNLSISVVTANSARATFGIPMFVHDFAVGSGRQLGPYSSLAATTGRHRSSLSARARRR
jgi:hypothetical protein